MIRNPWGFELPDDALGAVVHGPVVLGRAPGVAVGVRCVFAHPGGLHLPVLLVARGVRGEAAQRQHGIPYEPRGYRPSASLRSSWLQVSARVNGATGSLQAVGEESSSGEDRYHQESQFWIGELPADGELHVTVAWPEIGLPESTTTLRFERLAAAAAGAIPLT